MANVLTISEFFQQNDANLSGRKIQLCGKIVSEIQNNTFTFADSDTVIDCKILGNHKSSSILKKDRYIKIVKPGLERSPQRILILATTIILPSKKLDFIDDSLFTMLSEPFFEEEEIEQINEAIPITDLSTAQNLSPRQVIKKLLVKIVKTGPVVARKTQRGNTLVHCTIRDRSGLGYLDLWDQHTQNIDCGKIFQIENCEVDTFPPQGPPYYLVSGKSTKITDVTAEHEKEFEDLYLGDFMAKGKIEYIHSIFPYFRLVYHLIYTLKSLL